MGIDVDRTTLLISSGAALASALIGYIIAKKRSKTKHILKFNDSALMQYTINNSLRLTEVQEELRQETSKHVRHTMMGSADQIQFLGNLCKCIKAKKTLDIGVFTGYSAMSIAMVLPEDGKVVGCDVSEDYADIGRPFWKKAGVESKIDLRIGQAVETLDNLVKAGESGTFDFAFIDADKINIDNYYELSLQLLRPGGIIAIDNTLWHGKVLQENTEEKDTIALQEVTKKIHSDTRVDVSFLYMGDGTLIAFKL